MITIDARLFRSARALFAGLVLLLAGCVATPPGPLLSGPLPPRPRHGAAHILSRPRLLRDAIDADRLSQ